MPTQTINEFKWELGESFCIDQRQFEKKISWSANSKNSQICAAEQSEVEIKEEQKEPCPILTAEWLQLLQSQGFLIFFPFVNSCGE